MRLTGTADQITAAIVAEHPDVLEALETAQCAVKWSKRQIWPHEAAVLYALAKAADGGRILEIGTAYGYSAAVMAEAAPHAEIVTLNPKPGEFAQGRDALKSWPNVRCLFETSAAYQTDHGGQFWDLVFVDGSHLYEHVAIDARWWKCVKRGGAIVFHDFSPEGSARATPGAYQAITEFGQRLGREPDVLVVDHRQVGMAGWRRREGE
jgi:predicted O-methyltransferase YrrM